MASRKAARKRNRPSAIRRRRIAGNGHTEEADSDTAVAFIAEMLADLARMARRHRLDVLTYLLSMA
jgi:hypothetical protein